MIKVDYTNKTCGNYKVISKLPKKSKGRDRYLCKHVKTGEEKIFTTDYLGQMIRRARKLKKVVK